MQVTGDKKRIYRGSFEADCTILWQERSGSNVVLFEVPAVYCHMNNEQAGCWREKNAMQWTYRKIDTLYPINPEYFVYFWVYPKMTNSSKTKV